MNYLSIYHTQQIKISVMIYWKEQHDLVCYGTSITALSKQTQLGDKITKIFRHPNIK